MIGFVTSKVRDDRVIGELEKIAKRNELLTPKSVVDYARDKKSALHSFFEWDNTEAAEAYRREQARHIICRVVIRIVDDGPEVPIYVSISTDRSKLDGGYRSMATVLKDDDLKEQMLEDALNLLIHFKEKYARLQELAGVIKEIDKVVKKKKAA